MNSHKNFIKVVAIVALAISALIITKSIVRYTDSNFIHMVYE